MTSVELTSAEVAQIRAALRTAKGCYSFWALQSLTSDEDPAQADAYLQKARNLEYILTNVILPVTDEPELPL